MFDKDKNKLNTKKIEQINLIHPFFDYHTTLRSYIS